MYLRLQTWRHFGVSMLRFQGGTLPETNSSPLKMDGCKMKFLLGFGNFSGANC